MARTNKPTAPKEYYMTMDHNVEEIIQDNLTTKVEVIQCITDHIAEGNDPDDISIIKYRKISFRVSTIEIND